MNNPTQSKPTYNIQEGASFSDINRLTDKVSQSSSEKALNVKEEIESLVSSDQGFVRTLSNAINTLPSAGGVQDNQTSQTSQPNEPNEPSKNFRIDEGSFTVPEVLSSQTFGFEMPASVVPQVDIPTTINPPQADIPITTDIFKVDIPITTDIFQADIPTTINPPENNSSTTIDIPQVNVPTTTDIPQVDTPIIDDTPIIADTPQVNIPTNINPPENNPPTVISSPEDNSLNNFAGKGVIKEEVGVGDNTSASNLQADFMSMKSELESLAQKIKSELSSVNKTIGNITDILPIPSPPQPSGLTVGNDVTGPELLKVANEIFDERAPEGTDIRFERMAEGKFQQFINGSKGEIYSEQEIKGIINKGEGVNESKNDKENSDAKNSGDLDNKNANTEDKNEVKNSEKNPNTDQNVDESNAKTPKTSTDSFRVSVDLTGEIAIGSIEKFEIWDEINKHHTFDNGLTLEYSVGSRSADFIDEYNTPQNVADLVVLTGSPQYQQSFKVPLAKKNDDGGWMPLTQGGYYTLESLCINGVPCIFPKKII